MIIPFIPRFPTLRREREQQAGKAITPPERCDRCGETAQLAKVKGCLLCLRCGYKADCHGF